MSRRKILPRSMAIIVELQGKKWRSLVSRSTVTIIVSNSKN
jgi:hypothetical protein